jgi:hypothetical protein
MLFNREKTVHFLQASESPLGRIALDLSHSTADAL